MAKLNLTQISQRAEEASTRHAAPSTGCLAPPQAPDAGDAASSPEDELHRLRGALFGPAIGEQDEALARIENRIATHAAEVRGELETLARRLEKRVAELGARASQHQSSLREQMLGQADLLRRSIQERSDQTLMHVDRDLEELRGSKLDRSKLSGYLIDLGSRLEGEPSERAGDETR